MCARDVRGSAGAAAIAAMLILQPRDPNTESGCITSCSSAMLSHLQVCYLSPRQL
jgi:hypothetical protein